MKVIHPFRTGGNGYGALWFQGCSGSVVDTTLQYSSSCGVYVSSGNPSLTGVTYIDNWDADVCP